MRHWYVEEYQDSICDTGWSWVCITKTRLLIPNVLYYLYCKLLTREVKLRFFNKEG